MTGPWVDRSDLIGLVNGLPRTGHVYRFRDEADLVIYIGKTSRRLLRRLKEHRLEDRAWPRVARLEALEVPADRLAEIEAAEIHAVHPILNRVCHVNGCRHYSSERRPQSAARAGSSRRSRQPLVPSPWHDPGSLARIAAQLAEVGLTGPEAMAEARRMADQVAYGSARA